MSRANKPLPSNVVPLFAAKRDELHIDWADVPRYWKAEMGAPPTDVLLYSALGAQLMAAILGASPEAMLEAARVLEPILSRPGSRRSIWRRE